MILRKRKDSKVYRDFRITNTHFTRLRSINGPFRSWTHEETTTKLLPDNNLYR